MTNPALAQLIVDRFNELNIPNEPALVEVAERFFKGGYLLVVINDDEGMKIYLNPKKYGIGWGKDKDLP